MLAESDRTIMRTFEGIISCFKPRPRLVGIVVLECFRWTAASPKRTTPERVLG